MLSNRYSFATRRAGVASRRLRQDRAVGQKVGIQVIAIFVICGLGVLTGSAAGAGLNLLRSGSAPPAPPAKTVEVEAEAEPQPQSLEQSQVIAAVPAQAAVIPAPQPVAAFKPKPQIKPATKAPAPVAAPAPAAPVPQAVAPGARCAANQVMDDAKIHWLLEQSANTLAANPSQAAGAARVDADLRSALGRNLCASEAQALIANTCTDPAAVRFLNTMVSRLPFFIKPMVGNPCTADLVAVLNKVGRFMT